MDDMVAKGRDTYGENIGENNGQAILTEDQVHQICKLLASGQHTHQEIADMYGVTRECITSINTGKHWGWLTGATTHNPISTDRIRVFRQHSILTELEVKTIKRLLLNTTMALNVIAWFFGISLQTVWAIKHGKLWPNLEPLPAGEPIIYPSPDVLAKRVQSRSLRYRQQLASTGFKRRM
jgi:hypothetical protein